MKARQWVAGLVAGMAMAGSAEATLYDRGGGLIYDSYSDITWLSDMNYAQTTGFDADGLMSWGQAQDWAANLVYGGYSDWRLPTLNAGDTTCNSSTTPVGYPTQYYGYGCVGGELSHLFGADLGTSSHGLTASLASSVTDPNGDTPEQIANLKLFRNVTAGVYWSGTEYAPSPIGSAPSPTFNALTYYSNYGLQQNNAKQSLIYAMAVRPGDVAGATSVPEPETLALMLTGLLGAVATIRRRR